jgi:UDPglucose--hexose-1-phosphate uridylyltransferase
VRTIPNRFPTLASSASRTGGAAGRAFFGHRSGYGHHEVIIEGPAHEPGFAFLPIDQARSVVQMFRDRVAALAARRSVRAVTLFENYGPESGGTLVHPHAQVVATPIMPPVLAEEVTEMRRYAHRQPGGCLLETIADEERREHVRVVRESEEFLAVAPFASAHPYELLIIPRRHASTIAEATDAELSGLAELLPSLLRAEFGVENALSYNFIVHVAPAPLRSHTGFHWHLEVTPRLVRPDGFEVGTGIAVNPVLPEAAASALRAKLATSPGGAPETGASPQA